MSSCDNSYYVILFFLFATDRCGRVNRPVDPEVLLQLPLQELSFLLTQVFHFLLLDWRLNGRENRSPQGQVEEKKQSCLMREDQSLVVLRLL